MTHGKRLISLFAATALTSAVLAVPANAQTIADLQRQINALQAQLNEMKAAEKKKKDKPAVKTKWKGAPEFSSVDGNFKFKVSGRLMADYGNVTANGVQQQDRTEFRRARLGAEGVVFKDIKYKFGVDFAGNKVKTADAYLQWKIKPIKLTFGQFKTPNSLEKQTSSRYITFLERASITDAFGFSRNIGVGVGFAESGFTFNAGIFQGVVGNKADEQGRSYAARATYGMKLANNDTLVHIGASVRHRENDEGDTTILYQQRPHHHVAKKFVNTGDIIADSDTFFGVELAGVWGPFSSQAEWGWMSTDLISGGDNPTFSGGYIDFSYFITGEKRPYDYNKGAFGRVKVKKPVFNGGMGAWQVAVRYDRIDLTDGTVDGGEQDTYIIGVNWHMNNYTRIMSNYSHSDIEGGSYDGYDIDTFGLRLQVDW